ncbi:MAG: alpha-glucan family phosphorylase [Peptococcaceae bacterium]
MENKQVPKVAYFCMEYGLDDNLPIFSGGLGILAGDYLKAAKDLNLPVVGIGILWHRDYTTQLIGEDGYPYDLYPDHDFANLIDTNITVNCRVRGAEVTCKVWKVEAFHNVTLYLLDTDLGNKQQDWITQKLYGGADQDRVAQEIILGIGGIKALRALNEDIDVYHFNEGHAVFAGLELIKEKIDRGLSFTEAWQQTKEEVVFTTHTPVEAGNEVHDLGLLMFMEANDGLAPEQLEQLGGNPFNMTVAALRLSYQANAVSQLHGKTARNMWEHITGAAPIKAITNGVHVGTWQNSSIRNAFEKGDDLWMPHLTAKKSLFGYIKEKNKVSFDSGVLTIGFARRAAVYKRGGLIFKKMDILGPLLEKGRLQLIFSGKAHPHDQAGKKIIQEIVNIGKKYPHNLVFLENYNMKTAQLMVQGCDVWLNNPLRPMEASGTSGMKAALNGVLNISVIDGWVGEAVRHQENGWLLDKVLSNNVAEEDQNDHDLEAFYEVLLNEVIPIFYDDQERWVNMMKSSIKMAGEKLTSRRMIKEYYNLLYRKADEDQTYIYSKPDRLSYDYVNP